MNDHTEVAPPNEAASAGWLPDPTRRHESRYWDGGSWTEHVADAGVVTVDETPVENAMDLNAASTPKKCPECLSEIDGRATVCKYCGERIEGVRCPACLAMNANGARLCRWCSTKLATAAAGRKLTAFTVKADLIGTFLIHQKFHPQIAVFSQDKIVVTTYGFMALSSSNEEIPWEKVAGFRHKSGLIWDEVQIETRGQSAAVIGCLSREDGARIKQVMQGLEK
ncbi:MAG: DUF2510 domain-containing protein [Actinomycetota bacterium]|jgi:hypothetical protein|nr:DUF2510 domain-containing protein [Actinomycetota bacterium]